MVKRDSFELGSPGPGLKILGDLKLELIIMNPGEVQAAGEDFLAKILERIDDGEDPEEFLVRVLREELTETRQDLTRWLMPSGRGWTFDLDDKGRVLLEFS